MRKLKKVERMLDELNGPCYDLCACSHCWRGWSGVPFLTRLWWRIQYIRYGGWPWK